MTLNQSASKSKRFLREYEEEGTIADKVKEDDAVEFTAGELFADHIVGGGCQVRPTEFADIEKISVLMWTDTEKTVWDEERDDEYDDFQVVIRNGLEGLKAASSKPEEVAVFLEGFTAASYSDNERFKCEVLDYVPHMALILSEDPDNHQLKSLITSHLLPTVVRGLSDRNTKVVTTAEGAFITLLEHGLITSEYIEQKIWPILQNRMSHTGNKFLQGFNAAMLCGAVTLMSKMAPWIGSDITERLLVPALTRISADQELAVRKVCASHYGDFCAVVSTYTTEHMLLPSFLKLCTDPEWMVRKPCAETFTSVSCTVSHEIRKSRLAPTFARLLQDKSQWVRLAAFLSLGPFITTFADPSVIMLGYNHLGELVLKHQEGFEFKLNSTKLDEKYCNTQCSLVESSEEEDFGENPTQVDPFVQILGFQFKVPPEEETEDGNNNDSVVNTTERSKEDSEFNQFQYWRDPIPDIDNDLNSSDNNNSSSPGYGQTHQTPVMQDFNKSFSDLKINSCPTNNKPLNDSCLNPKKPKVRWVPTENVYGDKLVEEDKTPEKEVVPQDLIKHFVSMSESMRDLAHHCAYNLPAVALTLGPQNWDLIKPAYETLAKDSQWKVRKIVASSIHELAVMVGEEVATQDLVPVFNGFIKDLDEVRIAALKHLAHFLKLLRPAGRNSFLPRLTEFLTTDYEWNWRFRQELAEQLLQILGLFSPADTCHHLSPVVMSLLLDRVAEVRKVALQLVTELVSHVSIDMNLLRSLLAELAQQFAHSPKWNRRQTFALFCSRLVSESVLSGDMFARDVLPHLLDLSWDRVPNVRLTVARALSNDIMTQPYFADCTNPHHEVLASVIKRLQGDKDRDVRYFASHSPKFSYNSDSSEEPSTFEQVKNDMDCCQEPENVPVAREEVHYFYGNWKEAKEAVEK